MFWRSGYTASLNTFRFQFRPTPTQRNALTIQENFRNVAKWVLRRVGLLEYTVRLLKSADLFRPPFAASVNKLNSAFRLPDNTKNRHALDIETTGLLARELTTAIPPGDLIYLVNGHRDGHNYAASRGATVRNILELLNDATVDYRGFRSILDFGCGCGRILAGWEHLIGDRTKLYGFDINPTLIEFCQKNIPFATTAVSAYFPPLPLSDASVDFAYAGSVWTHLSLPAAMQWAGEFARVIAPGGVAMMSYHGSYFAPVLASNSREGARQLEEKGFYAHLHGSAKDTFAGSNNYATFMTSAFMRQLFAGFDVLRIYPGVSEGPNPFAAYQDIAVLRRV